MKVILEVLTRGASRDIHAFVDARSRADMSVCIPFSVSSRQLLVCVPVAVCTCMLTVDTAEQFQLHNAVTFTVNYEILCIKNRLVFPQTTPCNLINKQYANIPTQN